MVAAFSIGLEGCPAPPPDPAEALPIWPSPVSAGSRGTCWTRGGVAWCTGEAVYGALTPPDITHSAVFAGGVATCGLSPEGKLSCWGCERDEPPRICASARPPDGVFLSAAVGNSDACAVDHLGEATCWGNGQLPEVETGPFVDVAVGYDSCGLRPDGTISCWWSANQDGPFEHAEGHPWASIDCGYSHCCAVSGEDGHVECWGPFSPHPSPDPELEFVQFATGGVHSCGLHPDGTVTCFGCGEWTGLDEEVAGQCDPPPGERFVYLTAGVYQTCGVTEDGRGVCWGCDPVDDWGDFGQCVVPEELSVSGAIPVEGLAR